MTTKRRKDGYTISHETLEEMRFMAIRMVRKGVRVEEIAFGMRLNRSTVFGWVRKYRSNGPESLKSTKTAGAPSKLKQSDILKLMKMLRQPAIEHGFDSDLWTGSRVRILVKKKFGVRFHTKHMPRFLRRLGLVRKTPERRALEQNPTEVNRWERYTLPMITRQAAQCRGLILYGDEASFFLIPYVGKTWTFPDIKPVVRVSGKKGVHVCVTSAISAKGHLVFQFTKGNFNSRTLIRFIQSLYSHFKGRKIFFIIDRAPPHKSKMVERFVENNSSWLSLRFLPGYSPELNPDEEVWNYSKTKRLNAKPMKDKVQLSSYVSRTLHSLQKRPEKIKSFFEK